MRMHIFPKYLYRGDSDLCNDRKLKATIKDELLLTNLCSGGNGREIFSKPLGQLINQHINSDWNRTNFLSFSTEEQTALNYGSNKKGYDEVYEFNENWDFAVFTFDTTLIIQDSIKKINEGIYAANFTPACKEFLPTYKVILIDVLSHLKSIASKNNINLTNAINKASRDTEWLILPASPFANGREFTGKFDTACITDKRVFRYE